MASVTYFVAMPFVRGKDGELVAGEAQERQTAGEAQERHGAWAESLAGAVAFSRTGDPSSGEFADAIVLKEVGEVPSLDELLATD